MNLPEPHLEAWQILVVAVVWLLFWIWPTAGLLYLVYFCLTLPLRRQERARLFLDLVESGVRDGRGVEESIKVVAGSRDRVMGVRFHLLALQLESGCRLEEGLEKVPRLLPPQVTAMLKAGREAGDLRKVLPACRQLLADAQSQTRGALNYLLLIFASIVTPVAAVVLAMVEIYVLPQFMAVAEGMEVAPPTTLVFVMHHRVAFVAGQMGLVMVVWLAVFLYLGGPRLSGWVETYVSPVAAWLQWLVPWRRKRTQRDFTAMLALMLDAGLSETRALRLAADCTVNRVFKDRARQAAARLEAGAKLAEAVARLDDTGEFRWRLANACHARGGFAEALAGWNRALDAKAFQQEQAAAQIITTGLVVLSGLMVGTIAVSVFKVLLAIINTETW